MRVWGRLSSVLFRWDAETIHRLVICGIRFLVLFGPLGFWFLRRLSRPSAPVSGGFERCGLRFVNPVGLAAGFDKDGEILRALPHLGFGFVELGTVTPRPQPGHPRPRLFRDPHQKALFNHMGFNSQGSERVAARLRRVRSRLPQGFGVGINLGKNKDTSAEDAPQDYAVAVRPFSGLVDYVVVNVSSPNTPGLRDLQNPESLEKIVSAVLGEMSHWSSIPPLFLKLAPELTTKHLKAILPLGPHWGVSGWILTNTLGGRNPLPGGWSGSPLSALSETRLQEAKTWTDLPIISVGGIMNSDIAVQRWKKGAALLEIYSGWVFAGPRLPGKICRALEKE